MSCIEVNVAASLDSISRGYDAMTADERKTENRRGDVVPKDYKKEGMGVQERRNS